MSLISRMPAGCDDSDAATGYPCTPLVIRETPGPGYYPCNVLIPVLADWLMATSPEIEVGALLSPERTGMSLYVRGFQACCPDAARARVKMASSMSGVTRPVKVFC